MPLFSFASGGIMKRLLAVLILACSALCAQDYVATSTTRPSLTTISTLRIGSSLFETDTGFWRIWTGLAWAQANAVVPDGPFFVSTYALRPTLTNTPRLRTGDKLFATDNGLFYIWSGSAWVQIVTPGGGSGAADVTGPASTSAGTLPQMDATGKVLSASSVVEDADSVNSSKKVEIGSNGGAGGGIKLFGSSNGNASIVVPAAAGTDVVLTTPTTTGTLALASQIAANPVTAIDVIVDGKMVVGVGGGRGVAGATITGVLKAVAGVPDLVTGGAGDCVLAGGTSAGCMTHVATNPQTGTSYALLTGDRGKLVTLTNGASIAVSIAAAGSTGFASGWDTTVLNSGVGTATITPTTSTIEGAATLVLTTGQSAHIWSDGTNYRAVQNHCTPAGVCTYGAGSTNAGMTAYGQGTANTAPTTSVGFQAPTSVSSAYMITLPGAPAAGLVNRTNATPSVESIIAVASANTASAVVQRDGSGNFSAGTITAALTGNASTATNIAPNTGTTTTVLHGNASGAPSFGAVVTGDITDGTIAAADLSATLVAALATYTVTTDATTSRTLAAGDCGTVIQFTSASAVTVTVPTGLGAGCNVIASQSGAGVVSFTASSTTLRQLAGTASTAGQHAKVSLYATTDSLWDLSGQLAGAVSGWTKYTVAYSNAAFLTAATAVSVTLAALPAHVVVEGIRIKHSVAWAGTAVSSTTVSLGDGTTHTGYANAFDILQSVANTTQYWDGGAYSMTDAAHNLVARFTANTNFGNGAATVLTAGSVDIWVKTAVMP
jgi:hypothetical protein